MEHINIIKYFGKYPLKAGVLNNFKRDDNKVAGYTDLLAYFTALTPHSLIPDITEYVITTNESELGAKIKEIEGWFLMVEPGSIAPDELNNARVSNTRHTIQVTVGFHKDYRSLDTMASALISDKGLTIMKTLIDYLKTDDKEVCPSARWCDVPFQLDPVEPYLLYQSIGWQ